MHASTLADLSDQSGDIADGTESAAYRAAQAVAIKNASVKAAHFAPGTRVHFQWGEGGVWTHGTVESITFDEDGNRCAWVRLMVGWVHRERLQNLRVVCGVCPDCKTLNERPGCMS